MIEIGNYIVPKDQILYVVTLREDISNKNIIEIHLKDGTKLTTKYTTYDWLNILLNKGDKND